MSEPELTEQERRDIEVGEAVYYQADTTAITVYREQCEAAARADERAKVLAEINEHVNATQQPMVPLYWLHELLKAKP